MLQKYQCDKNIISPADSIFNEYSSFQLMTAWHFIAQITMVLADI